MDRIEFIVTYLCNSKCGHCQLAEVKKMKMLPKHVDKDKAVEIVRKVGQAYHPKSIMTFGGEPLLYPEIVCAIHEQAKKVGIPIREVITNGFWSTKNVEIEEIARNLASFGVNEVSISVDSFHQEFIPLKSVKKAMFSLIEAGIERVEWNPCWVVSKNHDNQYNLKTKAILQKLRNLQVKESEGNNAQPEGRACSSLAEFLPTKKSVPQEKCGDLPYTEALDSVRTISIEPDGKVSLCKNFYIGNAYESDIIDIIDHYDPHKIPEAKSILKEGMRGLLNWAKKRGVEPNPEGYYNICHMCTDLRERAITAYADSSH
ncbi:MAG TPA: radical SAM protein [Candidatus Acidoferrum sp.]|nr:radical SAM protein [Candidatus Acidoferrum sp.]